MGLSDRILLTGNYACQAIYNLLIICIIIMKYHWSAMRAERRIVSRDMKCVLVSHHIDFWCVIYCSQGEGSTSQTWTKRSVDKERSTLPRRRTGFNAGSLIPGSVSTMVSLPESDENQNVTTLASPSFQSMLDSDASSEYETDLEEDFPGKTIYEIICILPSPSPLLSQK